MALDYDLDEDEVVAAARREAARVAERANDDANWRMKRKSGLDLDRPRPTPGAHGVRSIGSVALIEPGCLIYSRTRSWGGTDDLTGELVDPIGGVVVEVVTEPVGDDGEFVRAFRVRWPYAGRNLLAVHVLTEDDVDPEKMEVAPPSTVVKLIRNLALGVGRKRANLFDSTDSQAIADCHHLAGSL